MSAGPNPQIEVLLATYNGCAYLPQQIVSVLQQDYGNPGENVCILARDDGSSDFTQNILNDFTAQYTERFHIAKDATPTGSAAGNFRELLRASSGPYVAFCDQDDVWQSTKLSRSMQAMQALERQHGSSRPLLVFSDLAPVDRDLKPVSDSLWRNNGIDPACVRSLPRLLGENVATGCTMLMNRAMADIAARMPAPQPGGPAVAMHDHWVALLAATVGEAAWLNEPTVLYRQHGGNIVGAASEDRTFIGKLRRLSGAEARAKRQSNRDELQGQAALFLQTYRDELSANDQETVQNFASLAKQNRAERLRRILRYGFWRGTVERNVTTLLDLLLV